MSEGQIIMSRRGRSLNDKKGYTYFITTTVVGFIKVFEINDKYYDILVNSLKFLLNRDSAVLIAYVLMPNHLHLVLQTPKDKSISSFMGDFKKFTLRTVRETLEKDGNLKTKEKLILKGGIGKYKLWMDRFDDVIVISDKVFEIKVNYIHFNPLKAGLVREITDWKYSSARNYYLNDSSVIDLGYYISMSGQGT